MLVEPDGTAADVPEGHKEVLCADKALQLLPEAAGVLVSPGIPPGHQLVSQSRQLGVPVQTDLNWFVEHASAPVLAVTGTNGKSTVAVLLGQMAEAAGLNVGTGGNLGVPALDLLDPGRDMYVLEVSSFQLEYCQRLSAEVAAVLNVHFDHLDRHGNLRRYGATKRQIFAGSRHMVFNRQDNLTQPPMWERGQGRSFGLDQPGEGEFGVRDDVLCLGREELLPVAELGWHKPGAVANALAALAMGSAAGLPMRPMLQALRAFEGLPHRCQMVLERDGVRWINDSKATNPASGAAAIESAGADDRDSVLLIAGGDAKGTDIAALTRAAAGRVRTALLIGRDAPRFERELAELCETHRCPDMQGAVQLAAEKARPGDCVLLAPGCATDDEFNDYHHRGEVFADLARRLAS